MLDFERIEKMLKGRVAVKKEFEKEFMVNKKSWMKSLVVRLMEIRSESH